MFIYKFTKQIDCDYMRKGYVFANVVVEGDVKC